MRKFEKLTDATFEKVEGIGKEGLKGGCASCVQTFGTGTIGTHSTNGELSIISTSTMDTTYEEDVISGGWPPKG
ncbi:hypothetical protein AB9P05_04670 [Roseivirga sp. BDSF3-8]|uniref:hypothetical protein n=1 Tax=Roseivirga sp. BDSF3-8 TaxID=3241598 RepID=UPI00353245B4